MVQIIIYLHPLQKRDNRTFYVITIPYLGLSIVRNSPKWSIHQLRTIWAVVGSHGATHSFYISQRSMGKKIRERWRGETVHSCCHYFVNGNHITHIRPDTHVVCVRHFLSWWLFFGKAKNWHRNFKVWSGTNFKVYRVQIIHCDSLWQRKKCSFTY